MCFLSAVMHFNKILTDLEGKNRCPGVRKLAAISLSKDGGSKVSTKSQRRRVQNYEGVQHSNCLNDRHLAIKYFRWFHNGISRTYGSVSSVLTSTFSIVCKDVPRSICSGSRPEKPPFGLGGCTVQVQELALEQARMGLVPGLR